MSEIIEKYLIQWEHPTNGWMDCKMKDCNTLEKMEDFLREYKHMSYRIIHRIIADRIFKVG